MPTPRPAVRGPRLFLVLLLIGGAACSGSSGQDRAGQGGPDQTRILVFAAASLTDAFSDIEKAFETEHPDIDVQLNLAGSSQLREGILEGAPVDVFASADEINMDLVAAALPEQSLEPAVFATNHLVIAVPLGNPAGIASIEDFSRPDLLLGVCAAQVPCGSLAVDVLSAQGVVPSLDTSEPDVRSLLAKIEGGDLDAGLVYATDTTDGRVERLDIPSSGDFVNRYPIVALGDDPSDAANEFVDFVMSSEGQAILAGHGFGS